MSLLNKIETALQTKDFHTVVDTRNQEKKSFAISPRVINVQSNYLLFFSTRSPENPNHITIASVSSHEPIFKNSDNLRYHKLKTPKKYSWITAPELLVCHDGSIRMFCEARTDDAISAEIISFKSFNDCLTWEFEQIIYSSSKAGYGTPSLFLNDNEKYELYCHEICSDHYHIIRLISSDGYTFSNITPILKQQYDYEKYAIYAPHVFTDDSDNKLMLYSSWTGDPDRRGSIFLAKFSNEWNKQLNPLLKPNHDLNEKHFSEPFLFIDKDKAYLFFEKCDLTGNWTIEQVTL